MKKNLFLCLLFLLGILNVSAQTTGNKGFKLNVNSGDAYLDCGDITQLNKAGAYTIEAWVNITLDELADRLVPRLGSVRVLLQDRRMAQGSAHAVTVEKRFILHRKMEDFFVGNIHLCAGSALVSRQSLASQSKKGYTDTI